MIVFDWFTLANDVFILFRYKGEREKQFKDHEAKFLGSRGDVAKRIDADTKSKIDTMNASVNANKQKVIEGLIQLSCDIKPQVHKNFRG